MSNLFIIFLTLLFFSCSQNKVNYSLEYKTNKDGKRLLTVLEKQSRFSERQNKVIDKVCSALTKKKTSAENSVTFKTSFLECDGSSDTNDLKVNIIQNGSQTYYESKKAFPFYQDETRNQGIIKNLCNQRSVGKLVAMGNHGMSSRYFFDVVDKGCLKDHLCISAATIVEDYPRKDARLIRKELFHVKKSMPSIGKITEREAFFICKDGKSLKRIRTTVK